MLQSFCVAQPQSLLLQMAKTHRVVLKSIDDASLFGKNIREGCLELGKKASVLVVLSHGRGVQRSLSYAKHIHEIADGLGISEVKARLNNLLQFTDQRLNIYETFIKGIHFLETLLKNMTSKVLSWVRTLHPGS